MTKEIPKDDMHYIKIDMPFGISSKKAV